MKHTYTIKGMTCGGCVKSVKKALEQVDGVSAAEVSLTPPEATIEMNRVVDEGLLEKAVAAAGSYKLITNKHEAASASLDAVQDDAKSFWEQYKPLLILVGLLLLVSVTVAIGEENGFYLGMRTFMAGFFLSFSFFKLLDLRGFAGAYSGYDLLASVWLPYAFMYPFIELVLGLAYTSGMYPTYVNAATIIVMGFSSIGVIRSVLHKREIRCACLGTVFNLPMSTVTIIEDTGMVAMAAAMLVMN